METTPAVGVAGIAFPLIMLALRALDVPLPLAFLITIVLDAVAGIVAATLFVGVTL